MHQNMLKGKLKEQWEAMLNDDISEIDEKLEKMSDLLQDDGYLKYDDEDYYMFFE